jgi:hypothetical protein
MTAMFEPDRVYPHTHYHRRIICPSCEAELDGTSSFDGEPRYPKDGDITLCFQCGDWAVFQISPLGVSISLRLTTMDELDSILESDRGKVAMANAKWLRVNRQDPRHLGG